MKTISPGKSSCHQGKMHGSPAAEGMRDQHGSSDTRLADIEPHSGKYGRREDVEPEEDEGAESEGDRPDVQGELDEDREEAVRDDVAAEDPPERAPLAREASTYFCSRVTRTCPRTMRV